MKILELRAENIKGLKAIDITPGDFVEIAGKNGAGKSSVLDAIWLALGGKDAGKDVTKALRNGAESGLIDLDLGTLKVRRTFNESGTTKLTVKAVHDGIESTVGAGQTTLDALRAIALDPAGFISLSPKDQRDALLKVIDLGIDLDEWAAERKRIFDERTEYGRRAKALGEPVVEDGLPEVERSASEIIEAIEEARKTELYNAEQIARLEQINERQAAIRAEIDRLREECDEVGKQGEAQQVVVNGLLKPADVAELREKLANVEETNAQIRANNQARAMLVRKQAFETEYEQATRALEAHDRKKIDALADAQIALEGLSIAEDGITYNGVPFGDLNSGAQIEVAFWILAELNPRLRIVQIRHGSLLDEDALAKIKTLAAENNFQVWIETVGAGSEGAVVIEAGEVK